ncbi:MAG: TraB/GumN family protein [Spirochaetales bacterium]|nr:TraB/GumN family protein [Spirochaetales bacterium]
MKLSIANVTLVGTSHVSEESSDEIKSHFHQNPVDIVCVELDEKRYRQMQQGEAGFSIDEMIKLIEKIGLPGFVLSIIISFFQRVLAFLFNIKPGYDMITAIKCAKKGKKELFFIDQDAELTLKNFSRALTIEEVLGIIPRALMYSFHTITSDNKDVFSYYDLRKVPPIELVRLVNKQTRIVFPSFYKTVIADRNKYMAGKILSIVKEYPEAHVLAVVGGGHMEGIAGLLKKSGYKSLESTDQEKSE